jgi:DNA invertase Pin-like site-specific DNA recombinase
MKKIAIYARVSTDKQTCENQLIELRAVAERRGYEIVSECDQTVSYVRCPDGTLVEICSPVAS